MYTKIRLQIARMQWSIMRTSYHFNEVKYNRMFDRDQTPVIMKSHFIWSNEVRRIVSITRT